MEDKGFRFEKLEVWQRAVAFSVKIYELAKSFPKEERFGFSDQIKRASMSVANNIAEGSARDSKKDFAHFLNIARGSLFEVVSQLYAGYRIGFFDENTFLKLKNESAEISKMLTGLRRSLLQ